MTKNISLESNWFWISNQDTWKWPIEWNSSQCPSKLRGWIWYYYQSICNLTYFYNLLKQGRKQCPGLHPTAPSEPGGIHTAHAFQILIGCLSYMLLFNLIGVNKTLQRTKRMCRIKMAMKNLKILNHTLVWRIKERPLILGYALILSSNYYYGDTHVRGNLWSKDCNFIVKSSMTQGTRIVEIKDGLWNESLPDLMLGISTQIFV